jgi:hypothetical protein
MARFKVYEIADVLFEYYVDAKDEQDARNIVEQGSAHPHRTNFAEHEVTNVYEVTDDDNK